MFGNALFRFRGGAVLSKVMLEAVEISMELGTIRASKLHDAGGILDKSAGMSDHHANGTSDCYQRLRDRQ